MSDMPTGIVTFLFTDIEGSTRLWERSPEAMQYALARPDELLRDTLESHRGYVFKMVGDGSAALSPPPPRLSAPPLPPSGRSSRKRGMRREQYRWDSP
jgi:class 3 adenylate cyclase